VQKSTRKRDDSLNPQPTTINQRAALQWRGGLREGMTAHQSVRQYKVSAEHDIGSIDKQWEQNPQLIRQFLDHRPDYEQLCSEVAYVLRSRLKKVGVEIAAVTFRAKTLASFLDKIRRKTYSDPLSKVTDFAGVRVVCLYTPDTLNGESNERLIATAQLHGAA
jgi:hypothetical protein